MTKINFESLCQRGGVDFEFLKLPKLPVLAGIPRMSLETAQQALQKVPPFPLESIRNFSRATKTRISAAELLVKGLDILALSVKNGEEFVDVGAFVHAKLAASKWYIIHLRLSAMTIWEEFESRCTCQERSPYCSHILATILVVSLIQNPPPVVPGWCARPITTRKKKISPLIQSNPRFRGLFKDDLQTTEAFLQTFFDDPRSRFFSAKVQNIILADEQELDSRSRQRRKVSKTTAWETGIQDVRNPFRPLESEAMPLINRVEPEKQTDQITSAKELTSEHECRAEPTCVDKETRQQNDEITPSSNFLSRSEEIEAVVQEALNNPFASRRKRSRNSRVLFDL